MALVPKYIVRANKPLFATVIFVAIFAVIHWVKPSLLYLSDGSFRPFGVGYKQKTVVPMWFVAIALAIFSYLAVLAYLLY